VRGQLFLGNCDCHQRPEHLIVQLQVILKVSVEGLVSGEPGEMVVAFQELVLALLDRIGQSPCTPAFLMHDFCFPVGDVALDSLPRLPCLVGADHRAENDY
jgi:hypothetical protein